MNITILPDTTSIHYLRGWPDDPKDALVIDLEQRSERIYRQTWERWFA